MATDIALSARAAEPEFADFVITQPTASVATGSIDVAPENKTAYEYRVKTGSEWGQWADLSEAITAIAAPATYEVRAKMVDPVPESAALTVSINTYTAPSGGGYADSDSGGGSTAPTTPAAPTTPETPAPAVVVDGKTQDIGKTETTETETKVVVETTQLDTTVETAQTGASVVVTVPEGKETATAELVVKNVETMAEKDMTLEVKVGDVSYELPTSAIDTSAVMAALGADNSEDVPVAVTITKAGEDLQAEVASAAAEVGAEVIGTPTSFTVTASYGGQTVEVESFDRFVQRVIEVTQEQAARITTAIVKEADSTLRHVPTFVTQRDGRYFAQINSRTNSTYALIANEVSFTDAGKLSDWARAAAEFNVGSGLIVGSGGRLDPDANITRAETATVVLRLL